MSPKEIQDGVEALHSGEYCNIKSTSTVKKVKNPTRPPGRVNNTPIHLNLKINLTSSKATGPKLINGPKVFSLKTQ